MILDWFDNVYKSTSYKQPEWEYRYTLNEREIIRKTGVSREQLREVIRLFKEYNILEREGI